ncbi:MAG: AmmeMemoRadiSam system protein B [Euryarchaeota archaeon]|nr:AmmeMemoRadiSam system protein B [Euryarchaeota archaeon]
MMREPAVAGLFYPAERRELIRQIERCFVQPPGPGELPGKAGGERDVLGAVVPHAGYVYSGYYAAHVYRLLGEQAKPECVVVLSPNHTGAGSLIAVSGEDWRTPLGVVRCDRERVERLWRECSVVDLDESAHRQEHSIEVQLPFLQYIYGEFRLVAITIALAELEMLRELGSCLSEICGDCLVLASSDFSHYEPAEMAEAKDRLAIEAILQMDEAELLRRVEEKGITSCGHAAIAAAIAALKGRASKAELLSYGNSGEVTGDHSSVVAYAGIVFRR